MLARADMAEARPAYRVFDETGAVLVLRSDMTVPIARVVATRYADSEPPLRFCYFAHCYRGVRPAARAAARAAAGRHRADRRAGAGGHRRGARRCSAHALDAVGLKDFRIGLGDASLFPALMASLQVPEEHREGLLRSARAARLRRARATCSTSRASRGEAARAAARRAPAPRRAGAARPTRRRPPWRRSTGMRRVHELLEPSVAARVIFDLGLVRNIGYYTGAVFEVYDPALGAPIGGGGRYDELLGRFGRSLPAVGFALDVDSLHLALAGRGARHGRAVASWRSGRRRRAERRDEPGPSV